MHIRKLLFGALFAAQAMFGAGAQEAEKEKPILGKPGLEKLGVYVVVSDLDRAKGFYEQVFAKPPYVANEALAGFDVAGGLFAVFAKSARDLKTIKGNSTVAYIRVRNAAQELERLRALSVPLADAKVVKEGPIELFRFTDPDGNLIEFFSYSSG